MSPSSERWKADLDSMIVAAERALGYVRGMAFESFSTDIRTQDAVIMNLVVLAEASKGIPADLRARASDIPWRAIAGFRNRATHTGQTMDLSLDLSVVWKICSDDLPSLLPRLRSLAGL